MSCLVSYNRQQVLVEDLLQHSNRTYSVVYNHMKVCSVCDPTMPLREYLSSRINEKKFNGTSSVGLVNLALKYERLFKKKNIDYPVSLINEFLWRESLSTIFEHRNRLDSFEIFRGVKLMYRNATMYTRTAQFHDVQDFINPYFAMVSLVALGDIPDPSNVTDVDNFVSVHRIMKS